MPSRVLWCVSAICALGVLDCLQSSPPPSLSSATVAPRPPPDSLGIVVALPSSDQPANCNDASSQMPRTIVAVTDLDGFEPISLAATDAGILYVGRSTAAFEQGHTVAKGRLEKITPRGTKRLWEGEGAPTTLVLDGEDLFFVTSSSIDEGSPQTLMKLSGHGSAEVISAYSGHTYVASLLSHFPYLYEAIEERSSSSGGTIGRKVLGQPFQALASPVPVGPTTIVGEELLWISGAALYKMSMFGGPIVAVGDVPTAPTAGGAIAVAMSTGDVFITGADRISRLNPSTLVLSDFAVGLEFPTHILSDQTYVYWDTGTVPVRRILRAAFTGGTSSVVALCQQPGAFAQDSARFFWIDRLSKVIASVPKS
jgi:hypothetical protein